MFHVSRFTFQERGITLVEVIVTMVIIIMFSMILIADFPKILRQFAISRASYKLSQDIRKTEDLGLSGVQIGDGQVQAKGYGVYVSNASPDEYIIYADRGDTPDYQYNDTGYDCTNLPEPDLKLDCIVELIDISKQESDIYIERIDFTDLAGIPASTNSASVNFAPPNPNITIINPELGAAGKNIDITLGSNSDPAITRTVSVNKAGLVEVK